MIKAKDLMTFLENAERLKISNIDLRKFKDSQMNDPPSLRNKLDIMQKEVDELIKTFDLTGDQLISPEEFFNIIMYAYS
jgi:Ca2+-binding EF-hand superfamily protein